MASTSDEFHWAQRVARKDIQRLYASDAQEMLDLELLEKVSYAIHARIADMLELREAQTYGRVTCRSCGARVAQPYRMGSHAKGLPLACAQCGWQVTCGAYYDSYTGKRMLPGAATQVFLQFMERWPAADTPQAKLLLIDWLIHEFHVNAGIKGRPVGENVIQGTAQQVGELIAALACGPTTAANRPTAHTWDETFNDPIRLWRKKNSYAKVLEVAAQLGIKGRSKMREDALLQEIYRLSPELFD